MLLTADARRSDPRPEGEASREPGRLTVEPLPDLPASGDAVDWDRCVPPGHFALGRRFLRCTRQIEMQGYRPLPLQVRDGQGHLVGIAASYTSEVDAADLGGRAIQDVIRAVRRVLPGLLRYQVVELGLPGLVGYPAHAPARTLPVMEALARFAIDQARRERNGLVVVRDIDPLAAPQTVDLLRGLGFQPTPLPPTFIVPLPFASFDEYRARMRSSYRRRLTGYLKATAPLRCEVVRDFAPLAPQLIELWRNVYERATRYHRLMVTQAFFEQVSRLEESRVLLLRRPDQSIAGFGLVYLDGPMLRYSCTGFTREAAREEGVYIRLLYELVRMGIEQRCQGLSLGQSTAEPKMRIGGRPVRLQAWIWHRSTVKRRALSWLTRTLLRPAEPPDDRNVFRSPLPPLIDPCLAESARQTSAAAGVGAAVP